MKFPIFPRPAARTICAAALVVSMAGATAETKKKHTPPSAPAPPAPPAVVEPPAKPSWLKRIKAPFSKNTPPAPVPQTYPAPVPSAPPAKNSKKGRTSQAAPASGPAVKPVAPVRSQPARTTAIKGTPGSAPAGTKTRKPAPPAPVPPPVVVTEEPKKPGFFARLKNKLTGGGPESGNPAAGADQPGIEKPERPADWQERYVVTEDSAGFFQFGPSQAGGADLRLNKGAVVKVAQAGKGWTRVELEGGRTGYMGSDQLRQAAETDFSATRKASVQVAAGGSGNTPQPWVPAAPMPDLPDLPMAPGTENSSMLLPPLDGPGAPARKNGAPPILDPAILEEPPLNPGDAVDPTLPQEKDAPSPTAPVPPAPEEVNPSADPPVPASPEPAEKETSPSAPEPEKPAADPAPDPAPAPDGPASPAPDPAPSPPAAPEVPAPADPAPAPVDPAPAPAPSNPPTPQ